MTKVSQKRGERGSLKWIQTAVEEDWNSLNQPIIAELGDGSTINWVSPRADDEYAEYRDGAFLDVLGLGHLKSAQAEFWPTRGPQWDALAITSKGTRLLVEAKAHVGEMCSPGSSASEVSLARIRCRLDATAAYLAARPERADWAVLFYQLANRLAHLHWLRVHGVDARLVLVNFLNDREMGGPTSREEWNAAYQVALHAMGLKRRHKLSTYVIEVYPDVEKHGGSP